MSKIFKGFCLLLAFAMLFAMTACSHGNNGEKTDDNEINKADYVGTWRGNDHDGEKFVHYLIFNENGYWNVFMNHDTLVRAIRQLPEQLVSFKIFSQLQKSGQTGCVYEYVEFEKGKSFSDYFKLDDESVLTEKESSEVQYKKVSEHSGEPSEAVIAEARDLFDRAREKALKK